MSDNERSPPRTLWTYAYQIEPPELDERFDSVRRLLDDEQAMARRGARTWVGRMVTEERTTHILVVSDSPERGGDINVQLEAELRKLRVGFSITEPMRVAERKTWHRPETDDPE